jgi:predicted SAM-dependent methyltransferase
MTAEPTGGLKLHLGCGPYVVPGWENVDKSPSVLLARAPWLRRALLRANVLAEAQAAGFPPGIRYADVSRRIPYPAQSASFIYSSHLIEHLSRWQALGFVRECKRVLANGGVMRVATPDLRRMTTAYLSGTPPLDGIWETPADSFMHELGTFHDIQANPVRRFIWRQVSGSSHQWLYDAESLTQLLSEGGLPGAEPRSYRVGALPDLDVLEIRPNSLFLEVRRS